jgi:NADH-quinone oxidoreductase subunit N
MSQQITAYVPDVTLQMVLPFAVLVIAAILVLSLDALLQVLVKGMTARSRDGILATVTAFAFGSTGVLFYFDVLGSDRTPFLDGMLRSDQFGNLGALVICLAGLAFTLMSPPLIQRRRLPAGELYALLIFAAFGMTMLTVANDLFVAFICVEILSLSLYAMVGIDRRARRTGEASFKYFILGAFASAFLVLGIAFLFGATGTTQLYGHKGVMETMVADRDAGRAYGLPRDIASYELGINEVLFAGERLVHGTIPASEVVDGEVVAVAESTTRAIPLNALWLFTGFSLLFVGLCFKLSLAPFHMWAPDVYEGAPSIVSMFVATASKVAAFAFLIHVVEALSFWPSFPAASGFVMTGVAVVSMVWGNLGALVQTNFKRLMAYSSISHGGYMTVAASTLVAPGVFGDPVRTEAIRNAIVFYLFAYTVLNTAVWGILATMGPKGEGAIANYKMFARRRPYMAFAMALALISLMGLGIPATVGFWGKFFIFKEAIYGGLIIPAVIAMLMSALSAYYYLRVVVYMYMMEPEEGQPLAGEDVARQPGNSFVIAMTASMIFLFGLFPALFIALGAR